MLSINPGFRQTGFALIYGTGPIGLEFDYGDCGPSKITATANALMYYGSRYNVPEYILYQHEQREAADPLSILWYTPKIKPADSIWYMNLDLGKHFIESRNQWVSMRSGWNSSKAMFVAMKAGSHVGRQNHGDLDAGDFVLDALGEKWAGELCQDDTDHLLNSAFPTEFEPNNGGGPSWRANVTSAYQNMKHVSSSDRMTSNRLSVMIEDCIVESNARAQWRMHTNASMELSKGGNVAHLEINGRRLDMRIHHPSEGRIHGS